MIETKIAGNWHSFAVFAMLIGDFMAGTEALAQGRIKVETPDLYETQVELIEKSDNTGREMIGIVLPMEVDFFDVATMTQAGDANVWTLQVDAPGALATCLYFDNFHLPVGSQLRFETPAEKYDQTWVEGPINSSENNDHHRWSNDEVPGESLVMIYECPMGIVGEAALGINGLGFFARHQNFPSPWGASEVRGGGSGECQVDVNCPEGDSWECEKDAGVKLRITSAMGIGVCSGSMVNNTARDCRQLLLSAFHCVNDLEEDDWAVFKIQYNYEYFDCGGTSSINSRTRTGAIPLTDSNDMASGNNAGSDFVLAEVEDIIPELWEPFYAGWDATGYNGGAGVSIHHPNGDRKKISTYSNPLTSSSWLPWTSTNAHWRVVWTSTETNHGVTEGGSSGSPIFEENHRIIGTLTGGGSFCNAPTQADLYGKMSYHWNGPNPIPTSEKLKAYLDPISTGEEYMDGSYVHMAEDGSVACDVYTSCAETRVEERFVSELRVSPNPSSGQVFIELPAGFELAEISWFDAMGRQLGNSNVIEFSGNLDLSPWGSGVRYVNVTTADGWSTTRRVVIQ